MDVSKLIDLKNKVGFNIPVADLADVTRRSDGLPCLRVTVDGLLTNEQIEAIKPHVLEVQECHHARIPEFKRSVIIIKY